MYDERWPARDLKEAFVWRGDAGYEQAWAGMLFNELKPQRYPDVIIQAASEADVVERSGSPAPTVSKWPCGRAGTVGSAHRFATAACSSTWPDCANTTSIPGPQRPPRSRVSRAVSSRRPLLSKGWRFPPAIAQRSR